jgi:hypothetical protein
MNWFSNDEYKNVFEIFEEILDTDDAERTENFLCRMLNKMMNSDNFNVLRVSKNFNLYSYDDEDIHEMCLVFMRQLLEKFGTPLEIKEFDGDICWEDEEFLLPE